MLIGSVVLLGFAIAVIVIGFISALVELALRNYHLSSIASLAVVSMLPVLLIAQALITTSTPLHTN